MQRRNKMELVIVVLGIIDVILACSISFLARQIRILDENVDDNRYAIEEQYRIFNSRMNLHRIHHIINGDDLEF